MSVFEVGLSDSPVFRDGISSVLSYAFLACKSADEYNGVVFGASRGRLKFYPNAQFWGISDEVLSNLGFNISLYDRTAYQGIHTHSIVAVKAILNLVRGQRGVVCCTDKQLGSLPKYAHDSSSSHKLHPACCGVPARSQLPEYEPVVEDASSST